MIADCCGGAATTYSIADPRTGQPITVAQCDHCRRELSITDRGPKWIRSQFFCADGECRVPIYRFVTHPSMRLPIPLWPDPNHLVGVYEVTAGPDPLFHGGIGSGGDPRAHPSHPYPITFQHYCGSECAPDLGALPHHAMEEGGDSHSYTIAPCVGVVRYAEWDMADPETFSDARGDFYRAWFADGLHLTRDEQTRLMALWALDRAA